MKLAPAVKQGEPIRVVRPETGKINVNVKKGEGDPNEKRIQDLEKRLEELMRAVKELRGEMQKPRSGGGKQPPAGPDESGELRLDLKVDSLLQPRP
jgi:hypothetical protein